MHFTVALTTLCHLQIIISHVVQLTEAEADRAFLLLPAPVGTFFAPFIIHSSVVMDHNGTPIHGIYNAMHAPGGGPEPAPPAGGLAPAPFDVETWPYATRIAVQSAMLEL